MKNNTTFIVQILDPMSRFETEEFETGDYVFNFMKKSVPHDILYNFHKELMLKDPTWHPNIDRYYKQSLLIAVLKQAQNSTQ